MRLTGFVALVVLSIAVSTYAVLTYGFFSPSAVLPPEMRATFDAHRWGLASHVFAAAIALALGPFQLSARLRARRPAVHRWMGRLYLCVGVLIGGVAGLFMAVHAYGGWAARIGFGSVALAWLYTGYRAYGRIRAGDVVAHRRWMVRNFSLTFAAVTLRLWLPVLIVAGFAFETAYPIVAWLSWIPNLLVAELVVRRTHHASIERIDGIGDGPARSREGALLPVRRGSRVRARPVP